MKQVIKIECRMFGMKTDGILGKDFLRGFRLTRGSFTLRFSNCDCELRLPMGVGDFAAATFPLPFEFLTTGKSDRSVNNTM